MRRPPSLHRITTTTSAAAAKQLTAAAKQLTRTIFGSSHPPTSPQNPSSSSHDFIRHYSTFRKGTPSLPRRGGSNRIPNNRTPTREEELQLLRNLKLADTEQPTNPAREMNNHQYRDRRLSGSEPWKDSISKSRDINMEEHLKEEEEEEKDRMEATPDAKSIFRSMEEKGLIPNAVAMLDGLCKDGLVHEAMKLFGLMREKGSMPEVVVYTAVSEGFCKVSQFDDAKRVFRKMVSKGISPNAYSYTIMIQGLVKGRKLEDAVEYCLEMLEGGSHPNAVTVVALVDAYCKEEREEEVQEVIGRLMEKGFAFDERGIREYLDKKGPFSPAVRELIFGKRVNSQQHRQRPL